MRDLHRFYVDMDLSSGERICLDRDQSHQITHVLRKHTDDKIVVFNGRGGEWTARVCEHKDKKLELELSDYDPHKRQAAVDIVLYQSLLKAKKLELVIQKATEVGVARIVPVITARTERLKLPKTERIQKIIIEAAEQSGRTALTRFDDLVDIGSIGTSVSIPTTSFVATLRADETDMRALATPEDAEEIALFVGPEGGFTMDEIEMLTVRGVKPISLGALVLRAETAAIVGISRLLSRYQ